MVEAMEVVSHADRVVRDRVCRPPLGRLRCDRRQLEQPLDELPLLHRQRRGELRLVAQSHKALFAGVAEDARDARVRVLDVVDGVLLRPLLGEVDVQLDRLVVAAGDEVPARRVHADRVQEVVEERDVAAPLGHLLRLAAFGEMDELVDEDLERVALLAEHLGERLQPGDVAVVVGAQDVDQAIEASRVLSANVGGVRRVVARRSVRADEDAILVVAVRARARPDGPLRLVRVEERDRLGDLALHVALEHPGVEVDAEALERRLDPLQHRRDGIAR